MQELKLLFTDTMMIPRDGQKNPMELLEIDIKFQSIADIANGLN